MAEKYSPEMVLTHVMKYYEANKDRAHGIMFALVYQDLEREEPLMVGGCSAADPAIMVALLKNAFDTTAKVMKISPEVLAAILLHEEPSELVEADCPAAEAAPTEGKEGA